VTEYSWRTGGPKPAVEAQVFGEFIEEFTEGTPIPLLGKEQKLKILKAAKRRGDIRGLFQWDDQKAGHLYRLDQLRHYCGALQIVVVDVEPGEPTSRRSLYSVNVDGQRGYVSHDAIRGSRDLTKQIIERARKELDSYVIRFQTIASFGTYLPALKDVLDQMRDDLDMMTVEATKRSTRARSVEAGQPANEAVAL
jgi:hypothetical protein